MDTERLNDVYEYLVEETGNRNTIRDRDKNRLLGKLLELCEYLRGEDQENPIPNWFEQG